MVLWLLLWVFLRLPLFLALRFLGAQKALIMGVTLITIVVIGLCLLLLLWLRLLVWLLLLALALSLGRHLVLIFQSGNFLLDFVCFIIILRRDCSIFLCHKSRQL